jgi:hypothetical protein
MWAEKEILFSLASFSAELWQFPTPNPLSDLKKPLLMLLPSSDFGQFLASFPHYGSIYALHPEQAVDRMGYQSL